MSLDRTRLLAIQGQMRGATDEIGVLVEALEGDMPSVGSPEHDALTSILPTAAGMIWAYVEKARGWVAAVDPRDAAAYGARVEGFLAGRPSTDALLASGTPQEALAALQGLMEAFLELSGMVAGGVAAPSQAPRH